MPLLLHRPPRPRGPAVGRGPARAGRPGRPLRAAPVGPRPAGRPPHAGRRRHRRRPAASWPGTWPASPSPTSWPSSTSRASRGCSPSRRRAPSAPSRSRTARCGAPSTVRGERLGEVAIRLGFATEEQVATASQAGRALGRALVDAGVLGQRPVEVLPRAGHRHLPRHAPRARRHLLAHGRGGHRPAGHTAGRNTQALLMDGIRRIDEMEPLPARIPGGEPTSGAGAARAVALEPPEQRCWRWSTGRRTVAEIARAPTCPSSTPPRSSTAWPRPGTSRPPATRRAATSPAGPRRAGRDERGLPGGERAVGGRTRGLPRRRTRVPGRHLPPAGPGLARAAPRRRLPRRGDRARRPGGPERGRAVAARALRQPRTPAPGRAAGADLLLPVPGRRAALPRRRRGDLEAIRPRLAGLEELAGGR